MISLGPFLLDASLEGGRPRPPKVLETRRAAPLHLCWLAAFLLMYLLWSEAMSAPYTALMQGIMGGGRGRRSICPRLRYDRAMDEPTYADRRLASSAGSAALGVALVALFGRPPLERLLRDMNADLPAITKFVFAVPDWLVVTFALTMLATVVIVEFKASDRWMVKLVHLLVLVSCLLLGGLFIVGVFSALASLTTSLTASPA